MLACAREGVDSRGMRWRDVNGNERNRKKKDHIAWNWKLTQFILLLLLHIVGFNQIKTTYCYNEEAIQNGNADLEQSSTFSFPLFFFSSLSIFFLDSLPIEVKKSEKKTHHHTYNPENHNGNHRTRSSLSIDVQLQALRRKKKKSETAAAVAISGKESKVG